MLRFCWLVLLGLLGAGLGGLAWRGAPPPPVMPVPAATTVLAVAAIAGDDHAAADTVSNGGRTMPPASCGSGTLTFVELMRLMTVRKEKLTVPVPEEDGSARSIGLVVTKIHAAG
jgi:hypothetical protein